MKFETIKDNYDLIPIVLVDNSGSTDNSFIINKLDSNKTNQDSFKKSTQVVISDSESESESESESISNKHSITKTSVLKQELALVKKNFESKGIKQIYLMFWDNRPNIYSSEPIDLSSVSSINIKSNGGTSLTPALKAIPNNWIEGKDTVDLFIYTDGEISDDNKLTEPMNVLFKKNVRMHIITVEANNLNYLTSNCQAGNAIFEYIRSSNLTFKVKNFLSYNQYHLEEPFVSFSNPDVSPGLAPFRNQFFQIDKTYEFVEWVGNLIEQTETNEQVLKLALDLSLTIHYLIKNKSLPVQNQMINMFCNLFIDKPETYKEVRKLFLQEIDNHSKGKSSTFQTYKKNREKVFEKAQLSLFDNVKESIQSIQSDTWVSFLTDYDDSNSSDNSAGTKSQYIISSPESNVVSTIRLSDKSYKFAGINISNYTIPMLPSQIQMDWDFKDQCVRQWIRANYSKKYKLNPASDFIQYYFLIDAMKVILSDISPEITQCYKNLCLIMLDRKRFGTDITEYKYLLTNPPAPVTSGSDDKINWILQNTMTHSKIGTLNVQTQSNQINQISPMTLWYSFVCSLDDDVLIKAQLPFCADDLKSDGLYTDEKIPSKSNIIKFIKSKFAPIKFYSIGEKKCNYDYQCYYTLEDTSKTGGYVIPKHNLGPKIVCAPRFVLSEEAWVEFCTLGKTTKCPVCCISLELSKFVQVKNESDELEKLSKLSDFNSIDPNKLSEPVYDTNLFEQVEIKPEMYNLENPIGEEIKPMDLCDFKVNSFLINSPTFKEAIGSRTIEIETQEEFNKTVERRYPFLFKLDWSGVCLAGGFCRSVLLRQRLKDFDFFFYGKDNFNTFTNFLSNLMVEIKQLDSKLKFLIMYKHQFNVFEVVCVNDPNNFFGLDYKLDNFTKYDFKSLHKFDKYTIIDPETSKVYRRNKNRLVEVLDLAVSKLGFKNLASRYNFHTQAEITDIENRDFSNYFEDGDVTGVRMKYRFQFILLNNKSIRDIFNKFDMYPCRVAWDGKTTWFTDKSEFAYKYMVNIINTHNYSSLLSHRLSKYFTYGFNVVMPELNIKKIQEQLDNYGINNFVIESLSFNINWIDGKQIMVEHNSHIADKIDSNERIEQKNQSKGKVLYKSSLFCSLVSLLRYVKINQIAYRFTSDVVIPDKQTNSIDFTEVTEQIKFIDLIDTRESEHDWYGQYKLDKPNKSNKSNKSNKPDKSNKSNKSNKLVVVESDESDGPNELVYNII